MKPADSVRCQCVAGRDARAAGAAGRSGCDDRRMRVPTRDYERQNRALWGELAPVFERVLLDDEPVLGAALDRFEANLARYHGVAHAIGMASGTDAIGRRRARADRAVVTAVSRTHRW